MGEKAQNSKRQRVLVADDNQEMRNTVIRLLAPNYEVVGAVGNGQALVEAESELNPDIGVIDISMPIMNGVQAAQAIRKTGSKMKIVFLTVNEDPDFVRAAFNAGANGYVAKREMASDLVRALLEVYAGRSFVSSCCALTNNGEHGG